jgi:hypothetical protein
MNDPHVHPRGAIVASLLHENSGMSLTEMSRKLKVPISSLFDTIKEVEKDFLFTIVLKESERAAPPETAFPLSLPTR